jgi:hypothetical protein
MDGCEEDVRRYALIAERNRLDRICSRLRRAKLVSGMQKRKHSLVPSFAVIGQTFALLAGQVLDLAMHESPRQA